MNYSHDDDDDYHLRDDFDKYVDGRLQQWALWFRRTRSDYGQGYLNKSPEFQHLIQGGVKHKTKGLPPLPSNDSAEEIELLIKIMAQERNKKIAAALRHEYLFEYKTQSAKARALGISTSLFKNYVEIALGWIRGWLIATEYNRYIQES